jgi:hypothetical protein
MAHAIMRPTARPTAAHPNILFIILDDVGIDQLRAFNPLAAAPPWSADRLGLHIRMSRQSSFVSIVDDRTADESASQKIYGSESRNFVGWHDSCTIHRRKIRLYGPLYYSGARLCTGDHVMS